MKVFQAVYNPYFDANQYVMTLMDGIDSMHNDVEWGWGMEKFWGSDIYDYDIIHIHWPDVLLWNNRTPIQIENRLIKLKSAGKKIISTCHNIEPHYCNDIKRNEAYKIVYGKTDMMLHLGDFSLEVMKEKLPNVQHVLLPHHTYDSVYKVIPNRDEACRKLGLNPHHNYIICFGAFRDDEERYLVKNLIKKIKHDNIYVLAPAYKSIEARNVVGRILRKYEKLKHCYLDHIIMKGHSTTPVPEAMTPYYYAVADVALIQRKKILNSGNVPLAFLMGKVVAGPNCGNVGLLLGESGNPTFDVCDDDSVLVAVKQAVALAKEKHGDNNRRYALENFSTSIIAEQLYGYYSELNSSSN